MRDVPIHRRPLSLQVQEFTATGGWVRFGTCGCIHHAGRAPSRAARAYGVHLQVRNATRHGPPVRFRHSRCTAGRPERGHVHISRVRRPDPSVATAHERGSWFSGPIDSVRMDDRPRERAEPVVDVARNGDQGTTTFVVVAEFAAE